MAPLPPPRVIRAVLAARRLAHRAADRLLPSQWALFEDTFGIARTHVIGTLAELGVADALDGGPRTASQLADQVGADPDALHRVMRAAAALGVLRLDRDGRFSLTATGRHLRADDAHSLRDWARYIALPSTTGAWAGLTDAVRTGEPAFPAVHGRSVWTHLAEHPDEEERFGGGMRWLTEESAGPVARGYPWPQTGVVCDVAGGVGTLLAAILDARPELRGVLLDSSGVLGQAERFLTGRGLRDRVELVEGDLFGTLEARADLFVLKDVLHDWDDERCAAILRGVRATMRPGDRVVLVESLQERNVPDPFASLADLQMLTQCDGGRQRSADELHALLRDAGLTPGPTRPAGTASLVEGVAG